MLKKFLGGLMFGAGFAIAFAVVWMAWMFAMPFLAPRILDAAVAEKKDFSFFKHSGARMKIPEGGGILAMAPITTPKGATRPSTYQLWLTESKLWQVRTTGEKVEVEELPRPADAGVDHLDDLMRKSVGGMAGRSSMTVSSYELGDLKSGRASSRDDSLNGKLSMTVEGVVFVQPNPY